MNISFIARFLLVFVAVFGAIFMFVWFYMSVVAPAEAAEAAEPAQVPIQTFEKSRIQLRSRDGRAYAMDVEVATTPEQLRQGLMHRTELPANTGMLFVFRPPRYINMWMKNTLIPLDMLFISRTGTVFFIHENAEPLSENIILAPDKVAYVLELPGGTTQSLGIQVGDRLVR